MADQFLGEIRLVAMNFPPQGWLVCDALPIRTNESPVWAIVSARQGYG